MKEREIDIFQGRTDVLRVLTQYTHHSILIIACDYAFTRECTHKVIFLMFPSSFRFLSVPLSSKDALL